MTVRMNGVYTNCTTSKNLDLTFLLASLWLRNTEMVGSIDLEDGFKFVA